MKSSDTPSALVGAIRPEAAARYFMQRGGAAMHIGALACIRRFDSSLNGHVHFHVWVVDGVLEEVAVAVGGEAEAEAEAQSSPPGIGFHPASAIDPVAVAQVQTDLRCRILRAFVDRGLLES